jgi:hypothetical protein
MYRQFIIKIEQRTDVFLTWLKPKVKQHRVERYVYPRTVASVS